MFYLNKKREKGGGGGCNLALLLAQVQYSFVRNFNSCAYSCINYGKKLFCLFVSLFFSHSFAFVYFTFHCSCFSDSFIYFGKDKMFSEVSTSPKYLGALKVELICGNNK